MKLWERACNKLLNNMMDYEVYEWPPSCIGLFFQPERPQDQPEAAERVSSNTDSAE